MRQELRIQTAPQEWDRFSWLLFAHCETSQVCCSLTNHRRLRRIISHRLRKRLHLGILLLREESHREDDVKLPHDFRFHMTSVLRKDRSELLWDTVDLQLNQ